jgi:hypothetical protein
MRRIWIVHRRWTCWQAWTQLEGTYAFLTFSCPRRFVVSSKSVLLVTSPLYSHLFFCHQKSWRSFIVVILLSQFIPAFEFMHYSQSTFDRCSQYTKLFEFGLWIRFKTGSLYLNCFWIKCILRHQILWFLDSWATLATSWLTSQIQYFHGFINKCMIKQSKILHFV